MGGNCEKYLAIILAGGVTFTTIGIDPKHGLHENEPHFEELFQSDRLNINGTSNAVSGIGVVHLFTDIEPHY